jgi:hypothetical protein
MRDASETQVDSGVRTVLRPRMDVRNFETASLIAAAAVLADKTTAPLVARPHFSPHGDLDVPSPPSRGSRG